MIAADLSRELGIDKGLISRWLDEEKPATPSRAWQMKLAKFFGTTPGGLFRHPDEEWFSGFFAGRDKGEVERMKSTLEAAFPRRRNS